MFRVTKLDSYFAVITYGEPELRLKFFMDALPKFKYELSCKEISLSFLSNFINSLRNNSSDFSVTNALKDKKVLASSLLDAVISKLEDDIKKGDKLTPEQLSAKKKKLLNMKVMKLAYKKKNNLLNQEQGDADTAINKNQQEETYIESTSKASEIENNHSEAMVIDYKKRDNEFNEEDNFENENNNRTNARRTCCYLYIFKKVKI
jgi:hypothetical protein